MTDAPDPAGRPDDAVPGTSVNGRVAWLAKSAYAAGMHGTGKVLTAVHLLPKVPPPRSHRVRHWITSLTRVHDSLAIAELDVPWWTYNAIDAVDAWLAARKRPIRVFEYGSGASTLWLAGRADSVHSVEHHRGFAEVIAPELAKHDNVTFLVAEAVPSRNPAIGSAKPGNDNLDFSDYVNAIDQVDGDFDLVIIDGRAREACLTVAIPRLAADGLIVFDNSHRTRYARAIAASGLTEQRLRGLTPTLPYPDRTSLLRLA